MSADFVTAGQIVALCKQGFIQSSPLGSCIAVMFYDKTLLCGGMAHVMLPGSTLKSEGAERYAVNAISALSEQMDILGAKRNNIECCLVGGANVLKKADDDLVKSIIDSVQQEIKHQGIPVRRASIGGGLRQTASLLVEKGVVYFTKGNSGQKLLFDFFDNKCT